MTEKERVRALEVQLENIREDIREIRDNHLAHIRNDLDNLKRIQWMGMGALAMLELVLRFL